MCGEVFHYLRVKDLYSHAIELYLKSFLLMNDVSLDDLRSWTLGHHVSALADKAMSFGLVLDSMQRLHAEAADDALFDRYISTGTRITLTADTFHALCVHLHTQIGPLVYKHEGMTRALEPLQ